MSWVSIQLGSREHYAIPAALHEAGQLELLITDTWLSRSQAAAVRRWLPSLAARRIDLLPDSMVKRRTLGRLARDVRLRLGKTGLWQTIVSRNEWFMRWSTREVENSTSACVFSYSYTARLPFIAAAKRGAKCILGQIDPGPREEQVVFEATKDYRHLAPPDDGAPQLYWDLWREEVAMADKIVVNSAWSAKLLVEAGVSAAKLVEIPLVYECGGSMEHGAGSVEGEEQKLKRGNTERLKALFLGSVILRKGVGQLFDAIKMLKNEPVEFTFAGPIGVKIPDEILSMSNVRFLGPVDKAMVEQLYSEADVFLFPTLSDGFGLTQLEALGHGLPVIASKNCGKVVEDRVSGLVLDEVTPVAIAEAVMELVRDRDLLAKLKSNARVPDKCDPRHLAPALLALE